MMTGSLPIKRIASAAAYTAARLRPLWRVLTFSLADDAVSHRKDACVSIEKSHLSVACGSIFLSRCRIKGFKSYPFADRYPQPVDLASTVSLALNEMGITGMGITLSIPKAWAVIKTAELPSVVKQNLPDVVSYELDRLTPFTPEDAYYDFRIIKEDNTKLLLSIVAARADQIDPYLAALKEKGFHVTRLTINLSGTGALCQYSNEGGDLIFLDLTEKEYEGAVFERGSIIAAFTGNFETSDDSFRVDTVMRETGPFIEDFRKQEKSPYVVALRRDKSEAVSELLKLRMNLPFRTLEGATAKLNVQVSQKGVPYAAVGGVIESLNPETARLNMLSKGHRERSKTPTGLTVVLLFLIIALWALYLIAPLRIEGERLKAIESHIAARKDDVRKTEALKRDVETLSGQISTISNFKENNPLVLNILKELTNILPKTTWLSRMRVTSSTVEIEGYAASATELLPKLEASKYFKKSEFASPTFRDARLNAERFNIKMEIEGIKGADAAEASKKPAPKTTGSIDSPSRGIAGSGPSGKNEVITPSGKMSKDGKK